MTKKIVINNITYNYAAIFFSSLVAIVIVPFLLSSIGKERYGLFVLFTTYSANGIYSFFDFGLKGSVVKYLAEDYALQKHEEILKIINTYLMVLFFASVLSLLINLIIYYFFLDTWLLSVSNESAGYKYLFLIFSFFNIVFFFRIGLDTFLDAFQRIDYLSKAVIYQKAALFAGTYFICQQLENKLELFIILNLILELLTVFYLMRKCRLAYQGFRIIPSFCRVETFHRIKGLGFDFFINRISGVVYSQTPKIILGSLDIKMLAEFDILFKFSGLMKVAMASINRAIFPLTSTLKAEGAREKIITVFVLSTLFSTVFASVIAILIMVFPDTLLILWLRNPEYLNLSGVLAFSVIWVFPVSLINAGSVMLGAVNKIRETLKWTVIGTILTLISALFFVKWWGLYGMFAAMFISSFFPIPSYLKALNSGLGITYPMFFNKIVIKSALVISLITLLAVSAHKFYTVNTILGLFFITALLAISAIMFLYLILAHNEKKIVLNIISRHKQTLPNN